jgi:hypothetical protein
MKALEMMIFAFIRLIAMIALVALVALVALLVMIAIIVVMTFITYAFVFHRLTKLIHFVLKTLRWIPRKFSNLQRQARVTISKELMGCLSPCGIICGNT